MGKTKKRKKGKDKPYCWYCDRSFNDEKILIQHQKAKHFKCHICHKKLSTASGMVVHVFQVHKETVTKVPNSRPGRDSVKHEIYGMEGVPDDDDDTGESAKKKQKLEANALLPFPGFPPPVLTGLVPGVGPGIGGPFMGLPPGNFAGPLKFPTLPPNWKGPPPPIPSGPLPPYGGVPPGPPGHGMIHPPMPHLPPQQYHQTTSTLPQQPLFPIHNGGQNVNGLGTVPTSTPNTPHVSGQYPHPSSQTQTQKPTLYLVYDDEEFSMEEKRAQLDKYSYSIEKIQAKVDELDRSIETRISSIGGLGQLGFEDE